MKQLECTVVFVMTDEEGNEGCPKVMAPNGQYFWMMHTGTEAECDDITKQLLPVAKQLGRPFRVVKFRDRVDETERWVPSGQEGQC